MENLNKAYKLGATTVGGAVGYLFGGWDTLLQILIGFVIADYVTGMMAAFTEGKLKSSIGYRSIPKKLMIFVMVYIANMLDSAIGDGSIFRNATIFFYLSNELLSIIENAGRMNVPIPNVIKKGVEVLRGRDK